MADRYDVVTVRSYVDREGNKKSQFTNIGTAWPSKNGDGFSITLNALPVATVNDRGDLETRMLLMPPKPRDDAPQRGRAPAQNQRGSSRPHVEDFDDGSDIPF